MKFDKAPFSISGEYDARKPFNFQGEHIAQGARFDWRRLGCGARKLRQLWDNGFIVPAGSLPQAPAADPNPSPNDSDPGDEANASEQTGASEPSAEERAKAEAEAKAKRVEAGKKSAEARKAKKAAEAAANGQPPKDPPSGEPS